MFLDEGLPLLDDLLIRLLRAFHTRRQRRVSWEADEVRGVVVGRVRRVQVEKGAYDEHGEEESIARVSL